MPTGDAEGPLAPMSGGVDLDEVLVRWMDITELSSGTVARWYGQLAAIEQARADRFRFPADRMAYVSAHTLVRALLSRATGLPAASLRFVSGPSGKPELDPGLGFDLRFNLSHTRGLVAIAACAGHAVGIDVEASDRPDIGLELAEWYFAPEEVADLQAAPEDRRPALFLRYWTLKESYIKATGEGMACPLDSFAFALDPIRISFRPHVADDPARWQFLQQRPTARHVLAVALRRTQRSPARFLARRVTAQDL